MNKTANYNLNQWEPSDKVQRVDFNADNAKIDAALKAQADALAGKASSSTVSSLSSTVAGHTSTLAKKGNCQLYFSTYTGSGQYGVSSPNTLSFPKKPLLVLISRGSVRLLMVQGVGSSWAEAMGSSEGGVSVTWSGNSVSWYSQYANGQMNGNTTYTVLALLKAD